MIIPFNNDTANNLYQYSTKHICKEFELEISRADEIFTTNQILDDIISALNSSAVVIADISGRNANVLYELGIAHTLKRPTIIVTHDGFENVPFDVSHFRIIQYKNTIDGKFSYEQQLRKTLAAILKDYRAIFEEEFEIVLRLLFTEEAPESNSAYALIGLKNSTKPINKNDEMHVEGHNQKTGDKQSFASIDTRVYLPFMEWKYVEETAKYIVLTDKGKAFAEFLEEKGFVCDYINEVVLTKGYLPRIKE